MKKFDEWNIVKQNIHIKQTQQYVKEGRVYWVSIGQNIGCEVSKQGNHF